MLLISEGESIDYTLQVKLADETHTFELSQDIIKK